MVWLNTWSDAADDALIHKREVERKHMKIIATEMGRSLRGCYDRYAKIVFLRKPAEVIAIDSEPLPPLQRILSLHERLGIETFTHRQAVLCEPDGGRGKTAEFGFWLRSDQPLLEQQSFISGQRNIGEGRMNLVKGQERWTPEQDQTLIEMRGRRLPWRDIVAAIGRSVEACGSRYRIIVPADERVLAPNSARWSKENELRLNQLRAEGKTAPQIAAEMGLSKTIVRSKIGYMRSQVARVHYEPVQRFQIPPDRIAERAARMAAERDLTASLCGDPVFSQSALGQKQQQSARRNRITLAGMDA